MDFVPVISTFLLILVAELGDKTQLAVISLSCNYKIKHVFLGAMLAFIAVDGISAVIGGTIAGASSPQYCANCFRRGLHHFRSSASDT